MSTEHAPIPAVPASPEAVDHDTPLLAKARTRLLGLVSLFVGIFSIAANFTLLVPAAGLTAGIFAYFREPASRKLAIWGIVLNGLMLLIGAAIILAFIGAIVTGSLDHILAD